MDKRIQKFLALENQFQSKMIYDAKNNAIYVSNPQKPTLQDINIILATHIGSVNVYSFVAEIKFHAQALVDAKSYFDKWYKAAIIADMGIGEGYWISLYQDYYNLHSQLVLEQLNIHKERFEKCNF